MEPRRSAVPCVLLALLLLGALACSGEPADDATSSVPQYQNVEELPVHLRLTRAQAADGRFISWREHLIDDVERTGVQLSGSDGAVMADLDGDGYEDVISAHESDTTYDGKPQGHIRIAFGTADPNEWVNVTLADGEEAGAAEDVAVADLNGDGALDIVAACELAHLIYFENPGSEAVRTGDWPRVIPPIASGRGSYIRAFVGDLNGDGRMDVIGTNKGGQNPEYDTAQLDALSWFDVGENPLSGDWTEHELLRVPIPINGHPVDLDGDGDLDIVGGTRGERRIFWLEGDGAGEFEERPIDIDATRATGEAWTTGFNFDFVDLSGDGALDIVVVVAWGDVVWLEQPADPRWDPWILHPIGTLLPDAPVGFRAADIDDDGDLDVLSGSYSRGRRDADGDDTIYDPLGRIAWFQNPGDAKGEWTRHDVLRRKRGMYDQFVARDLDGDGDVDFVSTRGNSEPYDGVFWLEQVRTNEPLKAMEPARSRDSEPMRLPTSLQPPEATSLRGVELFRPDFKVDVRADLEEKLANARADLEANAEDPLNWIWVGRRIAYLGRYQDAIAHYTEALERFPDEARLYRHRGHRYLSTRQLDASRADFERAAELVADQDDRPEPDGLPNAAGVLTSTTQSNIWYHLGLVRYLQADYEAARQAYDECLAVSGNPDMLVATTYWAVLNAWRLGDAELASRLLEPITDDLELLENHSYYDLLRLFAGRLTEDEVLGGAAESPAGNLNPGLENATTGYGVGAWHWHQGRQDRAKEIWDAVVSGPSWAAFGFLAAEAELAR